jgi:very-short-patch-repair endonuclease
VSHPIERNCPICLAEPGQPCISKRGTERRAFHRQRGSRRAHIIYAMRKGETESPIEELLAGTILGWLDHHEITVAAMTTQVKLGPYRADILVEVAGHKLVVECDGQAFHSSLEAVAHDKRRDRYCAVQGIAVMRFTGAEIHRDPRGCAAQVGVWIRSKR